MFMVLLFTLCIVQFHFRLVEYTDIAILVSPSPQSELTEPLQITLSYSGVTYDPANQSLAILFWDTGTLTSVIITSINKEIKITRMSIGDILITTETNGDSAFWLNQLFSYVLIQIMV